MSYSFQGNRFVGVMGLWKDREIILFIFNVYALCVAANKVRLWNDIGSEIRNRGLVHYCITRDFNCVAFDSKRRGFSLTSHHHQTDMAGF
jgi:hypothetical protein